MDITSYILSKKYVEDTLNGAGALAGKSAYEIACENGFKGTPTEWLASLKGDTPQIGPSGTWVISGVDTGVLASPSIAGYATEEFVNQQIANIPKVDLTPYATRKELSEAILGIVIPDVSEFVTQKDIDAAIAAIKFPEPDLTPYATKAELNKAIKDIPEVDLTPYATKAELNKAIADIPEVDLTPYAKKSDIPSIGGLATEDYVDEKVGAIIIPDMPNLDPYALKSEIPSIAGLASEEYVAQKIAEAELNDKEVDLSAYATKTELQNAIDNIQHPSTDLSDYATKAEVEVAIDNIVIPEVDLSNYATKDEIPSTEGLASEQYVIDKINEMKQPSVNLEGYATEEFVRDVIVDLVDTAPESLDTLGELAQGLRDNADVVDALNKAIANKADKNEIPSLEGLATEDFVNQKINEIEYPNVDLTGYATEEYVQRKVAEAQLGGDKEVDLSAYYTKSEIDKKFDEVEHPVPDLSGYATEEFVENAVNSIAIPSTEGLATEEFVEEAIASIQVPDVTGLASETYVDEAIAAIEHPTVDLEPYAKKEDLPSIEGLASEAYVNEKFNSIKIPDVDFSGLATEEYVQTAIADLVGSAPDALNTLDELAAALKDNSDVVDTLTTAIGNKADKSEIPSVVGLASEEYVNNAIAAIPEVDLSNYATRDELPSTSGLASETYVNEAIAAIKIPEAKPDINVYEITSESAVLDELVALLPEGVEIHSGDVMLVSNSMGVKSAYQFDEEWIACDGNVDASRVIMPFDITLAGSYERVGNLSKTSTGTATFATKGKSVAAALQEMLSKREQPSIKTNPSVSLTSTNGAKEVGTKITPTWNATLNAGSYTYGPATGITASKWEISDGTNTASTASGSFPEITVGDNTNYKITAKATYAAGTVAKDNLGDPSNPTVQIAAGSKSKTGSAITGYRAWFMYIGTDNTSAIDSAFIRGATNKGSTQSTQDNVTIPQGTKRIVVAIPANGKNLTSVIDVDGMGLDVFGNFTPTTVDVEGLNGYAAKAYNVWVAENANGMAATHYNLVIG